MDRKEDIGKILEEKMKGIHVSPQDTLWETIKTSLDQRDKNKKRKLFFLWLMGGTALLLLLLLTPKQSGTHKTVRVNANQEVTDSTSSSSNKKTSYFNGEESLKKPGNDPNTQKESIPQESTTKHTVNQNKERKQKYDPMFNDIDKKTPQGNHSIWLEESDSTSTKYYYYNDSTKELFETKSKKFIDSILSHSQQPKDSLSKTK